MMKSIISDVIIKPMKKIGDERGWLSECFRIDEIDENISPVMSYLSITNVGMARGPHEHLGQTDYFCFPGPSSFKLCLWDNRPDSCTYNKNDEIVVGEDNPVIAIIPPGVVHAYKNIGKCSGLVINYPNKLYAGFGKKEKVDEVRHENDAHSRFDMGDRCMACCINKRKRI